MITTNFYLDTRSVKPGAEAPLKISITKGGSTTYIPIGVSLLASHWNKDTKKVVAHPRKTFLNTYLAQKKLEIDEIVLTMMKKPGYASMSVTQIKKRILETLSPVEKPKVTFVERLQKYADESAPRTKELYLATLRRLRAFRKNVDGLTFEEITVDWLNEFDKFLKKTSPARNARNIHFRNIRAVFNDAKRNDITTWYPFDKGKFEIRAEKTRKRSLKLDVLRKIFNADLEEWQEKYRDMFKLIFLLIGINFVDLCRLKEIEDGRIEFRRAKTKRLYSIKVEPEALELIEKYRGKGQLLYMLDNSPNYRVAYMQFCRGLNSIKDALNLPELSSYWARHTWATIASDLEISKDIIAESLGHGGNTVTDIYIDPNQKKVDIANRRVIDWVLYGKR